MKKLLILLGSLGLTSVIISLVILTVCTKNDNKIITTINLHGKVKPPGSNTETLITRWGIASALNEVTAKDVCEKLDVKKEEGKTYKEMVIDGSHVNATNTERNFNWFETATFYKAADRKEIKDVYKTATSVNSNNGVEVGYDDIKADQSYFMAFDKGDKNGADINPNVRYYFIANTHSK